VCGTKNFASVRLYSAPQLHRTMSPFSEYAPTALRNKWKPAATIKLIHYRRLGAKPHESSASGGHTNAFKGSKAPMRRAIGTTDTRCSEPRPPREPAGFAMPFRSQPTLKFSAEVFPLLGTSS
jgi:hypothetical protein